jgi:hypothetical protein
MNNIGKIGGMLLLVMCMVGAQAQSPAQKSAAKPSHAKPRTQEQLLLEQLNEKFQELEQINGKYNNHRQIRRSQQRRKPVKLWKRPNCTSATTMRRLQRFRMLWEI